MTDNQIYGIDLGTTYSCIAYVDEYGKPVVVPNSNNDLATPSVVYFETANNIVVGETAKEVAEVYPHQVVSTVKRVMGDNDWQFENEEHIYTPQEISSHILRKVVADAEANTGHEIKDVVITVPAYFGVNQKEATKQAGELAGLNVLYVIPEPTAAAISYGMEQKEDQVVLVYDLGGGTFDITVIEVKEGAITVICTGGDHELGGRNWDEALANYFAQCFADETGVPTEELTENAEIWQELLNSAERCKKALSNRITILERISHEGETVRVELSREKLEEITSSFMERTLSMTEALLQTAKDKGYEKIGKLLLVGGSSYMPQVKEELENKFSFEILLFDPNQSVAKGAALFGYKCFLDEQIKIAIAEETGQNVEQIDLETVDKTELGNAQEKVAQNKGIALPGLRKLTETRITNVTSKSFGIVVVNDAGEEKVKNLIVINDAVPKDITREFFTYDNNQESVNVRCIENTESKGPEDTIDLDPAQEIGNAELLFSRALPKGSAIAINFSLTPDGLLSIHGKDLTTHGEITAKFKTESILSREELEEKREHNMGNYCVVISAGENEMATLAVGIDLGTTNSAIAYVDKYGKPVVIPNDLGQTITPSVICFKDGERLIGEEAKEMQALGMYPVAAFFKRQMGDDLFIFHADGVDYSATDLSTLLLKKIKRDAEAFLEQTVTDAVITVPAYFRDRERNATIEAGKDAGINVLQVINEPTAAAVAFGLNKSISNRTILIYDLGGGTFDVTLLELEKDSIRVKNSDGDHQLGGKDWDDRVIEYLATKFQDEYGVDPLENTESLADLLVQAEESKKRLTTFEKTKIAISHDGEKGRYELNRSTFEELTSDLMERTMSMTMRVLEDIRLKPSDVDGVLLVGGLTRMPMVHSFIEEQFGKPPMSGVNVDEAVALGAALAADERINCTKSKPEFALRGRTRTIDVTNHSLGMIAINQNQTAYVN